MERAAKSRRDERDMISSLPDCLIHLIMSFLTAQEAVQTCVLSKRWQYLWTTLPFLDFDVRNFKCDIKSDDNEWDFDVPRIKKFEKFRDFVSTTLLLRKASDLHKLRLSCLDDGRYSLHQYHVIVKSWILYALKHNLQVFKIGFDLEGSLPLGVFNCASLVDASLSSFISFDHVKVIDLPCLRRLFLGGTKLNQEFVEKLFSGCPMLEFLQLEDCCKGFSAINSQSLKYLKMQCACVCDETEKKMELINAPNLLSFCYDMCPFVIGDKILLKMPLLTSACIFSDMRPSDIPYNGKGILIGLSNVQYLKLSGGGIKELLENELLSCPEFSNLKNLSVRGFCLHHRFNLLASFLNHCPNLEKLSLCCYACSCHMTVQEYGNQEPLVIAPYKGNQLKTVEVEFSEFFKRSSDFPQFVKYLQDLNLEFECSDQYE
ncbi:F-box/RNI-like superfamily protein [Rhynchospora pubera]|uniref:F-box/RNI-like superfamily protein n=1 Tax=Rhynchospora pubera TaxID=906938 RepID=A0AAV8BNK4_9POAL|nr:F-box/RNI-like superfamily protein [Rhynchospora pubera]